MTLSWVTVVALEPEVIAWMAIMQVACCILRHRKSYIFRTVITRLSTIVIEIYSISITCLFLSFVLQQLSLVKNLHKTDFMQMRRKSYGVCVMLSLQSAKTQLETLMAYSRHPLQETLM